MVFVLFLVGVLSCSLTLAADDHDDHDHHDHGEEAHAWEWSAIFEFSSAGHYVWSAEKSEGGSYADASMKMLILPAAGSTAANLESAAHAAEQIWSTEGVQPSWTVKSSGDELEPGSPLVLNFDQHSWLSIFEVHIDTPGTYAFFCEHFPIEFENRFHYLKTETGEDVEPAVEGGGAAATSTATETETSDSDRWGEVILGSFLTVLPTLIGIVLLKDQVIKASPITNAFASGVIFAAAVFLLLPEGLHLVGAGATEQIAFGRWGSCVLAGWVFSVIIHHVSRITFVGDAQGPANTENTESTGLKTKSLSEMFAVAGPVLFGDFMHNFCDGIIMGVSFKQCSVSFAWLVVGVTVLHELPQELADFVILVQRAGMKWYWALLSNFLSGMSAVIGAIIAYGVDISINVEGGLLVFGAGVYLYVAMTELGPDVVTITDDSQPPQRKTLCMASLKRLLGFSIGAILIGLVLIGHEHCPVEVAEGAPDPHAGHNH